jgi:signal recognition particle receptor subunit beta
MNNTGEAALLPPIKIVISGPVSAGKSTFVRTLSETTVVSTDEVATEKLGKLETTVAMDFGTLLFDKQPVYLFGTPGQERFSYMWEILCQGAIGLVVLVAGNQPRTFPHARMILECITSRVAIPVILGVTRQDAARAWAPEEVADYFGIDPDCALGVDARKPADCRRALYNLLGMISESDSLVM